MHDAQELTPADVEKNITARQRLDGGMTAVRQRKEGVDQRAWCAGYNRLGLDLDLRKILTSTSPPCL